MYAPMLATSFKGLDIRPYLEGARWVIQQKFDGNRVMIVWRPGAAPQFITRNGTVYTKRIPAWLKLLARPEGNASSTFILDGELVGEAFYAFDLLEVHFADVGDARPYRERRQALVKEFTARPAIAGRRVVVVPEADTQEDKALFVEQALQQKCEGVVIKDAEQAYYFGRRSPGWLKVKFERTADVIVIGVRTDGKESAIIALRDGSKVREVGKVSLLGKEKRQEVRPGMVVEVKYLYASDDHILQQPRILRVRDDKAPVECTVDQLVYTDKGALVR